MIIINADDWGRSVAESDAALSCFRQGRLRSVSAMVFMRDSARAAALAGDGGLDVGLHLNLSQRYDGPGVAPAAAQAQERIVRFMTGSKYAVLLYHPFLRRTFREVYQAQAEEFHRLYGRPPSHVDGHQHRHLCANLLLEEVIPRGQRVRKNFSFWPGEKSLINRTYRRLTDGWFGRRYRLTDYFFSLGQCLKLQRLGRVFELAKTASVELMTHPLHVDEFEYLTGPEHQRLLSGVEMGTFQGMLH